ncbi:bifunctional 4-hydroxy-2-oxoglutarate aldolase/2-dehydro-3-deoxy-phosphogluconate aldolase [Roseimarinus sediminis]|uniref:bifunctional 4-hydroxy-2-oxoglutarate aldolase/2-dehydro-3-deoxy-phosphogluconate aldolase n=1 Tax=Roseimarinus sediminis TaxID=1610899 RepID=UPI003D1D235E
MAKYSRIEVFLKMKENGMVPLYYSPDVEKCKKVVKACYDGGARSFEFTNRGDFAHEVFAELSKYAKAELPGMALGVGSVIDAGTTSLYIQLGADFIVSPLMNPEMAKACNRRKVLWSPGCGSVSEVNQAEELGCELIKIFPGSQVGGPAFVKAVKGPCPWTDIMPSGGVTPEYDNLKAWFDAGATCVGMGSQLMKKEYIETGDFEGLAQKVKETLELIQQIRSAGK